MLNKLKSKRSNTTSAIVSTESGTAVVGIRRTGKIDANLQTIFFNSGTLEEAGVNSQFIKANKLHKIPCSTLLNINDYQLLVVDAPEVPPQELRAAVRWQIKDMIDFHVDDAVVDVFDAPPGGPASNRKQMYVVVARNTVVKEQIDTMESAGVNLSVIDIPELAMRNLATQLPEDANGLVTLYFGQQLCLITITRNSTLYLTRTVEFNYSEPDNDPQRAIELCERLALEIQRSLDYYEQHFRQATIQTIAVLPQPGMLEDLRPTLEKTLGLTVRSVSMSDIVSTEEELAVESASTCLLAVGCALRKNAMTL